MSLHHVFLLKESSFEETPEEESSDGDKEEVSEFTGSCNNRTHCLSMGVETAFQRRASGAHEPFDPKISITILLFVNPTLFSFLALR